MGVEARIPAVIVSCHPVTGRRRSSASGAGGGGCHRLDVQSDVEPNECFAGKFNSRLRSGAGHYLGPTEWRLIGEAIATGVGHAQTPKKSS
jgi:hypothetical protein